DAETGTTAWAALKGHFEKSTIGYRMSARKEFYDVFHDTSRPISAFIQSLLSARRKLEAFGVKIDDTEFKDVLLMNLDESFHAIRLNILAQSPEPDLEKVKVMLASSTSADSVSVKLEGANAARGRGTSRSTTPFTDDKGYRWCDPDSDGCHRCGRKGHRALFCIYDMPRAIKDQVMKNPRDRSSSPTPSHHARTARSDVVPVRASAARIIDLSDPYDPIYHASPPNSDEEDEWYNSLMEEERAPRII
ncbi:hypothetical protein H0H92_010458, partial [Tricholoma furcatifolium]